MPRLSCLFGLFLLLSLSASPVSASQYICRVYFADEAVLPGELDVLLEGKPGAAVRVCAVPGRPETLYRQELSKVSRGSFGACQFMQRNVFLVEDETGGSAWRYRPPSDNNYVPEIVRYMLPSEGVCPRQGDLRYVLVSKVPEGLFMALMRFWTRFSSPEHFEEILSRSPAYIRHFDGFETLERVIMDGTTGRGRLKPSRIGFDDSIDPLAPSYEVVVYAPRGVSIKGGYQFWSLGVDLGEDGFRLLRISVGEH